MNSEVQDVVRDEKQLLREWVTRRANRAHAAEVCDDTPILERRVISSIEIMELILFIEKTTGKPVDVTQLRAGVFRSINTIFQTFFECSGHE